jgi:hypothetical protein
LAPKAVVDLREYPNSGHALLDGSIDLKSIFDDSIVFKTSSQPTSISEYDIELDVPMPSSKDIAGFDQQFKLLRQSLSPVFLSRGKDNFVRRGLSNVPTGSTSNGRPVLLVGNHQLYGADLYFLISEFLKTKNTLVRGLAHPIIFADDDKNVDGSFKTLMKKFGAVKVSPSSYYQVSYCNINITMN